MEIFLFFFPFLLFPKGDSLERVSRRFSRASDLFSFFLFFFLYFLFERLHGASDPQILSRLRSAL